MIFSVIVAGGKGIRMKSKIRKQYISLSGRPVLSHTLKVFKYNDNIEKIFLVVPENDFHYCNTEIILPLNLQNKVKLVPGGKERQDSVYNALLAIDEDVNDKTDLIVVIHDGVRPFINNRQIEQCVNGAKAFGACILGIPVFDTLKHVNQSEYIKKTIKRESVWLAQTPQAFQYNIIKKAHELAKQKGFRGTDDASLIEWLNMNVKIVSGSRLNFKITTQEDILYADAVLSAGLAKDQDLKRI